MVAHGLIEHRAYRYANAHAGAHPRSKSRRQPVAPRIPLRVTGEDIARWQAALASDAHLIAELSRDRGWLFAAVLGSANFCSDQTPQRSSRTRRPSVSSFSTG
jgi:hypothetical protein